MALKNTGTLPHHYIESQPRRQLTSVLITVETRSFNSSHCFEKEKRFKYNIFTKQTVHRNGLRVRKYGLNMRSRDGSCGV